MGVFATMIFGGCEKSEITGFSSSPSINFEYFQGKGSTLTLFTSYSFLTNPTGEYIQNIPVIISGNVVDYDRKFAVEIVKDSTTTATANQYEIIESVIHANRVVDTLRIKLLSSDELNDKTVSIKLRMIESEDFKPGMVGKQEFQVNWTNKVVVPTWGVYFRTFFCAVGSTQAYRIFVQTTGLTNLVARDFGLIGQPGVEALGTVFGDYIKQWNKDNPNDILLHDDGTRAGQPIVPVLYTRTKFD